MKTFTTAAGGCLLFLVLLCPKLVQGQQQLDHPPKLHVDSLNRIYFKDKMPAYLFIGNTPDPAKAKRMYSEATPDYANPMYFDGQGVHYMRHKDNFENVDVLFEIRADGQAPDTKFTPLLDRAYQYQDKWYGAPNMQIELKAKDNMAGVDAIYYSIDGATYQKYNGPITLDQEKEYTISYYSVDNVGNVEKPNTQTVVTDNTGPRTGMEVKGKVFDDILSRRNQILLAAQDAVSGVKAIYYTIDQEEEKKYNGPVSMRPLSQGAHTLSYYAVDKLGNREAAKEYNFYVDNTAPLLSSEILGDRFITNGRAFSSGRTQLKLNAVDNKAGVEGIFYSVNGGTFEQYKGPFYLSKDKNGSINVRIYATDKVGNRSEETNGTTDVGTSYVDLTGPNLSRRFAGPRFTSRDTVFISPQSKVVLAATDAESGIKNITYSLNGSAENEYANGGVQISEAGAYAFEYFGYDNVNNRNKAAVAIFVDAQGPQVFERYSLPPLTATTTPEGDVVKVYPSHVVVFLSSQDDVVGYERMYVKLNQGAETLYRGPMSGFAKGNSYTLTIRALDKLGNETTKTIQFNTAQD